MKNTYANLKQGDTFALVKTIMKQMNIDDAIEATRRINSGEWIVSRRWREENGIIYFSVISSGITGPEWIKIFEKENFNVGKYAKKILFSPNFKSTDGIKFEIAVLKGKIFGNNNCKTYKIQEEAELHRHLIIPKLEIACLIRKTFSDNELKEMGLDRIIIMHEYEKGYNDEPALLIVSWYGNSRWLDADHNCRKGNEQESSYGFAYVVSSKFINTTDIYIPEWLLEIFSTLGEKGIHRGKLFTLAEKHDRKNNIIFSREEREAFDSYLRGITNTEYFYQDNLGYIFKVKH